MLISTSEMTVPRLELAWSDVPDKPLEKICWLNLVLPLRDIDARLDYHEGANKETKTLHIPICHTVDRVRGHVDPEWRGPVFPQIDGGRIDLPFRDKMHAVWDAGVLNLPLYASYKDQAELIASPGQVIHNPNIALSEGMGRTGLCTSKLKPNQT